MDHHGEGNNGQQDREEEEGTVGHGWSTARKEDDFVVKTNEKDSIFLFLLVYACLNRKCTPQQKHQGIEGLVSADESTRPVKRLV